MIDRFVFAAMLFLPMAGAAQQMDHSAITGAQHAEMMGTANPGLQPTESGQSAFAAIQEVVTILERDRATDWSKVNIEALRQHLIDMNAVTLDSAVESESIADGMRFTVTGNGPTKTSIRRMVFAHAATMNGVDGWGFKPKLHPDGAVLEVSAQSKNDRARISALGFIGVLTRGMHHQNHHLMIASGNSPHS